MPTLQQVLFCNRFHIIHQGPYALHAPFAGGAVCLRQRAQCRQCVLRPAAARRAGRRLRHQPRGGGRRHHRHPVGQRAGPAAARAAGRPGAPASVNAGAVACAGCGAGQRLRGRVGDGAVDRHAGGRHAGHGDDARFDRLCRDRRHRRRKGPRGGRGARRRGGRPVAGARAGRADRRYLRLAQRLRLLGAGHVGDGRAAVADLAGAGTNAAAPVVSAVDRIDVHAAARATAYCRCAA
jgi:hypothetical protein